VGLGRPRARPRTARGGCHALERDGASPEGASGPRARRRLARGGVRPSSEAETPRRGALSLNETEIRPRGTAADRLVGRCGFLGRGPFFVPGRGRAERVCDSQVCLFMFYYFSKGVFSLVIRGPLWLSSTRITYAELLDPSPGGPVGVGKGHVRRRRAIVPRNVRKPSKEVSVPRHGDVDRPYLLANTRQSSQHRGVLQTKSHLADGGVERVHLWSPPVHERGDQRGVVVEPRQPLRSGNLSS
jgi:hypothetical protein